MAIGRSDLRKIGRHRRRAKRRSPATSRPFAFGTFSLGRIAGKAVFFVLVLSLEKADTSGMTTTLRPKGLRGWSVRCAGVALSLAFCASAFAGTEVRTSQPDTS